MLHGQVKKDVIKKNFDENHNKQTLKLMFSLFFYLSAWHQLARGVEKFSLARHRHTFRLEYIRGTTISQRKERRLLEGSLLNPNS